MTGSGNRSVEKSQWITEKLCLAERLFLLLSSCPSPSSWLVQVGCAAAGTGTPNLTRARHTDRELGPACASHAPARRAGGQLYSSFIPTGSLLG